MNPKNRYILRFILRPVLGLITGYTAGKSGVTTVMKKYRNAAGYRYSQNWRGSGTMRLQA